MPRFLLCENDCVKEIASRDIIEYNNHDLQVLVGDQVEVILLVKNPRQVGHYLSKYGRCAIKIWEIE